jgi:hypothetical protein
MIRHFHSAVAAFIFKVATFASLVAVSSTVQAANFYEFGDSFGNIARPYNAGAYAAGRSDTFFGTMSLLDTSDCLRITLARPTTITVTPSRSMEITIVTGTRLAGRNFPRFGALSVALPAGTHIITLRNISASSISYSVNVRGN